jgi:glycosyltransferase involved in cell wall biosynthesis
MSVPPLVTVVIPAFNASRWIVETLQAALSQTLAEIEVLVIDDGSTDETAAIVERAAAQDPRVRLIVQGNAGVGAARNRGIAEARGRYIAPLDADDLWGPSKLELQVRRIEELGERVGLVYCWSRRIDEQGAPIDFHNQSFEMEGEALSVLIHRNVTINASVPLFRREALDVIGHYLTREEQGGVQGCEDWDLCIRIAEKYRIGVVRKFLVGYRQTAGCMSAGTAAMARSFEIMMSGARRRNPYLPECLFKEGAARFHTYLAAKSYLGRDHGSCISFSVKSASYQPSILLKRSVVKRLGKSVVLSVLGARTSSGRPESHHGVTPTIDGGRHVQ